LTEVDRAYCEGVRLFLSTTVTEQMRRGQQLNPAIFAEPELIRNQPVALTQGSDAPS
jgi:hypothetical protein